MLLSKLQSGISDKLQGGKGEGSLVDGMSGLLRLNETDFNLLIVGFLGRKRHKEKSEKYFSKCS